MMGGGDIWKAAAAIALPNVGALVNGQITRKNLRNWYANLNFPPCRPPSWIFAPMWTSLYVGMGYASYLVWRDGGGIAGPARASLAMYGIQLSLNWAWPPIFFGQHNIGGALIDVTALTAAATGCGILFYRVNRIAGYLFVPYVLWLGYATYLNYRLYQLNPSENEAIDEKSS